MPVITAVLTRAKFPAWVIPRRAEHPQGRVACDHDARIVAVAFRIKVDARRETATERLLVPSPTATTRPAAARARAPRALRRVASYTVRRLRVKENSVGITGNYRGITEAAAESRLYR